MSQNNTTEGSATKASTVKSYASRVFQESTVGLVSSIAHTFSKNRKVFKLFALTVCLIGFLYQSTVYLMHVLEYPTAVNIELKRPNSLEVPSFTFCDNNRINRKLFCQKFPERCEEPDEAFCRKYPDYCGESKSLKPKEEYYSLHDSPDNVTEFRVELDKFVTELKFCGENITGPFTRINPFNVYYSCYSINDRVDNSLSVLTVTQNTEELIYNLPDVAVDFRVSPEKMFLPDDRAGVYFSLHSPFEAVNPLETGVFMRPGYLYMIHVTTEEENLKKSPYDTDCTNYTELWEKNGRSGPRSKKGCQQKCLAEATIPCYGCVDPYFLYPGLGKACKDEDNSIFKGEVYCRNDGRHCYEKCKDDCRKITFRFQVHESPMRGKYNETSKKFLLIKDEISVEIFMKSDGLLLYKHNPKYMAVEVFSCIGGFIGIWLGISLLDVSDICEGIVRIFHYSLKKSRVKRKVEKNTRNENKIDENGSCVVVLF